MVCHSHHTCSAPPLVPCLGFWLPRISWRRWAQVEHTRAPPCQATGCSGTEWPSSRSAALWGSLSDPVCEGCAETRERGRKRSIKISSVLLACSAEKVLDSDRGNLQLCLLLGGDRVRGKIHVGTGNNSKTRTPKQQCTWEKEQQVLCNPGFTYLFPTHLPLQVGLCKHWVLLWYALCLIQTRRHLDGSTKAWLTFLILVFLTVKRRTV